MVYLSERKLRQLALDLKVRTGSFDGDFALGGEAGLDAGVPPVGRVSAKGSVQARYSDPAAQQKAIARQLDAVIKKLGGDRIPNLETGDNGIRDGKWFRFHRQLRFGIGHADSIPDFKALIVVDERPVSGGPPAARLLMNGSVAHVLDPYATEEMRNSPGNRSGSSSDHLFIWLDEARRVLEADPGADLGRLGSEYFNEDLPPRNTSTAMEMYGAFAEERSPDPPVFPRLLNGGPCEGVAQVSFVAVNTTDTLVLASPLFVRVRALLEPRRRWWRRSRA
ncbi:MAG TPA: SAVMC3_10250 family protein [Solirubrobacterales bacterium]